MKNYTRRSKALASINIVPYIDVMLVLLIIFMVTAPLLTQGLNVELPNVAVDTIELNSEEPIIITIKKSGAVFVNISKNPKKEISGEVLVELSKNRLRLEPRTPILIRGDKNARHGDIIRVMGFLRKSGIKEVGIMTEPLDG